MDKIEHKLRHQELHKMLDELIADYILHTNKLLSNTTLIELIKWSYEQTIKPMELKK